MVAVQSGGPGVRVPDEDRLSRGGMVVFCETAMGGAQVSEVEHARAGVVVGTSGDNDLGVIVLASVTTLKGGDAIQNAQRGR